MSSACRTKMLKTASRNLSSIFVALLCFGNVANTQDTQYDNTGAPGASSENPFGPSSSWDDFWAKLQDFLHVQEGTKSKPLQDHIATEDVLFASETRRSSTAVTKNSTNSSPDVVRERVDTTGTNTSHTAETAGLNLANGLSSPNWTLALDSIPRRFFDPSSTRDGQSSQNESQESVAAATASSSGQPAGTLWNKTGDQSTVTPRTNTSQAGIDDGGGNKSPQSVAQVSPGVTLQSGAVTENLTTNGNASTNVSQSVGSEMMNSSSQQGLWSDQKTGPTPAGDQVGKSLQGSFPAIAHDGGAESLNSAPYKVSDDDDNNFNNVGQSLTDSENKGISAMPLNHTTLDCDWMNQSAENAFVRMIDRICRVLKPLPLVYHIVILLTLGLLSVVVCLVSVKCLCGRKKKRAAKEDNQVRKKDSAIERGTRKEKRALLEV
ncbi:uncharacterized protein [Diadema antillarum]|uniref:uncharacterized protein n=1 Tax=Diadema antillarum TaxID=105358 RepID=UPI003A8B12EA